MNRIEKARHAYRLARAYVYCGGFYVGARAGDALKAAGLEMPGAIVHGAVGAGAAHLGMELAEHVIELFDGVVPVAKPRVAIVGLTRMGARRWSEVHREELVGCELTHWSSADIAVGMRFDRVLYVGELAQAANVWRYGTIWDAWATRIDGEGSIEVRP